MKQFFLTVLVCITAIAGAAQQKTDLEGAWKLDSAEIKQITQKGDTVTLPYIPDKYANSTDCIYPELKIQSGKISCTHNNEEYAISYDMKDDTIFFMFTAPIKFTFEMPSKNKLVLWRQYSMYDNEKSEAITLQIRIVYNKV
jgi:hypothetical protein